MTSDSVFWLLFGLAILLYLLWVLSGKHGRTTARQEHYRHVTGLAGEQQVHTVLTQRFPPSWVLRDVTLPDPNGGYAQIDHILVSQGGIFVIETKQWAGRIDASPRAAQWLQWFPDGQVRHYQNPLHQNIRHLRVVRYALARVLPAHLLVQEVVQGLVVFTGSAEPMRQWPAGVGDLVWLRQVLSPASHPVLQPRDVQQCLDRLHALRLAPGPRTDRHHRQTLQRRHGRSSWL